MCAEAVPWRCDRSLIADALSVRGTRTKDIMSPARRKIHTVMPFVKSSRHHSYLSGRRFADTSKERRRLSAIGRGPSRQNDRTDNRLQNI